jgi:hypothetical protein
MEADKNQPAIDGVTWKDCAPTNGTLLVTNMVHLRFASGR